MIEQPPSDSATFRRMADAIDHNKEAGFGGAAVIVIPGMPDSAIEVLILDPKAQPAQFIATIATRLQVLQREADDKARQLQGFR